MLGDFLTECFTYQNLLSGAYRIMIKLEKKEKCPWKTLQLYPKDKFEAIFQNIIDSGILDDIDHDTSIAASIGGRLQTKIISYCKVR